MNMLITISGKSSSAVQSAYSMRDINKMARALVGRTNKVIAVTVNFDERTGNTRLIASYETAPNQQTFASMAI